MKRAQLLSLFLLAALIIPFFARASGWAEIDSPTSRTLYAIDASGDTLYAVGENGTVVYSDDEGE